MVPAGGSSQLISNLFMPCRTGFFGPLAGGWMATGGLATSNIAVQFNQGSWLINTSENPPKLSVQPKMVPKIGHNELKGGKEVGFTLFLEV